MRLLWQQMHEQRAAVDRSVEQEKGEQEKGEQEKVWLERPSFSIWMQLRGVAPWLFLGARW